jgi:Dyp-type peroxidase family
MASSDNIQMGIKWWLSDNCAEDVQALLAGSLKELPNGAALMLALHREHEGGCWIQALIDAKTVTPASESREDQAHAGALALTLDGLRRSGLKERYLEGFSGPFREGMTEVSRAKRLGDALDKADEPGTIQSGGLLWSGGKSKKNPCFHPDCYQQVHALLLLYAKNSAILECRINKVREVLPQSVAIVRVVAMTPLAAPPMREHFGFADGVSQPIPCDHEDDVEAGRGAIDHVANTDAEKQALQDGLKYHRIWAGDILFGRRDAYGERVGGPFVPLDDDPGAKHLDAGVAAVGYRDFGWNGSYLVVRELCQDASRFWVNMGELSKTCGLSADAVAEKIVGRRLDGKLLTPDGGATANNDVGFAAADAAGIGCPRGSHIRRANPRDAGARDVAERRTRLASVNNHRILRRGRTYGPRWERGPQADSAERGLLFMCFNTDLMRQFEFVQQTWLLNQNLATLGQTDPLMGPKGQFSIDSSPVRRRVDVQTFVRFVGGEYFFLPSIKALTYLAQQPITPATSEADGA